MSAAPHHRPNSRPLTPTTDAKEPVGWWWDRAGTGPSGREATRARLGLDADIYRLATKALAGAHHLLRPAPVEGLDRRLALRRGFEPGVQGFTVRSLMP
jgi:hypothetical protein